MDNRIDVLREEIKQKIAEAADLAELDKLRVSTLGKKGSITALLKGMKDLSNEERKTFGAEVNKLKASVAEKIEKRVEVLNQMAIEAEINLMPVFDVTTPPDLSRGSYHPITLSQRQCEAVFKSMGFTVEDYPEVVTDYECFESVNIPKHHPARDMQDTYYLENGQLLKSQTSAAQNAILRKYGKIPRPLLPQRGDRRLPREYLLPDGGYDGGQGYLHFQPDLFYENHALRGVQERHQGASASRLLPVRRTRL